jgi:protein-disulfide isomerase
MATKRKARSQQGVGKSQRATSDVAVSSKIKFPEFKIPNFNVMYVLVTLLIVGSFFLGRLTAQVEYLKKGVVAGVPTAANNNVPAAPQQQVASPIDIPGLKKLAEQIKLDTGKFEQCLSDGKYEKKVKDSVAYGSTLGVSGTPSFFINGLMLVGAQPQTKFEQVIDAELKDKSGDKVAGVEPGGRKTITGNEYKRGGNLLKDAPVKIVEFSDFQCPYCEKVYPTIKALESKYGSKISLEYRQYPLSFHPNAQKAAEASECAGEQGKFWEMHDAMFEAQKS